MQRAIAGAVGVPEPLDDFGPARDLLDLVEEDAMADRTYRGRLTESAVGAHLFNTASTATHLHYWRDDPHEVDFVLKRGPHVVGFEVKSGPRTADERGREAFAARFPPGRTLLVGEGGVPLNEFLATPADYWLDEP